MLKLLMALALLPLAACGPNVQQTAHRDDRGQEAAATVGSEKGQAKDQVPVDAEPPTETAEGAKSGGLDDDDDEKDSVTQSPTQSPHQSPTQTPIEAPALTIQTIRYSGGACPDGSVAANLSPDRHAFTLLFDSFAVEVPALAKGQTKQGSCDLEIDLISEKGWQLTLLTVDERGYAALNPGDLATLTTTFGFGPKGKTAHFETTLHGAMDDNFQKRATARLLTAPWSGCEAVKTLRINLAAAIKAATDLPAFLAVDAVDGELHHEAGLAFRRCD